MQPSAVWRHHVWRQTSRYTTRPQSPYKLLDSYEIQDAASYFGRKTDISRLMQIVLAQPLVILCGESGVGKSSLVKAGVIPLLAKNGFTYLYVRCGANPAQRLRDELSAMVHGNTLSTATGNFEVVDLLHRLSLVDGTMLVIFVDQFEELFTKADVLNRNDFIAELAKCMSSESLNVRFVLCSGRDFLEKCAGLTDEVPGLLRRVYTLKRLTRKEAKDAIILPVQGTGREYEAGFPERIIDDLALDGVAPSQLQIVCSQLYENAGLDTTIRLQSYTQMGGAPAILGDYLGDVVERFPPLERSAVQQILAALITGAGQGKELCCQQMRLLHLQDCLCHSRQCFWICWSTTDSSLAASQRWARNTNLSMTTWL